MAVKFVFLVLPNVHILDLAGADQAIHEAIDFNAGFTVEHCGIGENIQTTSGMPIAELEHFSRVRLSRGDFIVIPGAAHSYLTSPAFLQHRSLFHWIVEQHANGVNICSICLGAFVLAETGLLDGKSCTTHFKKTADLQQRYPEINVIENILYTDEETIYTSAGIASGIDLTLHIIEKLKGSHMAHLVARELVVYNRRNGNATQLSEMLQFRNHIHAGIHKAQDYIITHINKKTKLPDLSDIAGMSERNFTRIFKKETGVTVNQFITAIRREVASGLMSNPDLSFIEIANKVGLQSEKQLRRITKPILHEA